MAQAMSFEDAIETQDTAARVARSIGTDRAREIWSALAGQAGDSTLSEAIELTADAEVDTILAKGGDSARVYALAAIARHCPKADHADAPTAAVRAAWGDLKERAEKAGSLAEGFGWDLSDAFAHERDLGDAEAEQAAAIAKLAGAMVAGIRKNATRKVKGLPGEIYDVELGGNLRRLLKSQRVRLGNPKMRVVMVDKIARKRALQYAVQGDEKVGKGPLVVVVDESGSMHDGHSRAVKASSRGGRAPVHANAGRNTWAKAATIALCRVAHAEGRPVVFVPYSTQTDAIRLDPNDAPKVLDVCKHFFSGGNYQPTAIKRAAKEVEKLQKSGDDGADVVLITDGVEGVEDEHHEMIDAIKAVGSRLWTIAIACDVDEENPIRKSAERFTKIGDDNLSADALSGAAAGSVL